MSLIIIIIIIMYVHVCVWYVVILQFWSYLSRPAMITFTSLHAAIDKTGSHSPCSLRLVWRHGPQLAYFYCVCKNTHTRPFNGPFSATTHVSRYQKGKPIWILLKQETVSGSGISWDICKSAPRSRQITTPAPHHSDCVCKGKGKRS